jgi:hypothetical protein
MCTVHANQVLPFFVAASHEKLRVIYRCLASTGTCINLVGISRVTALNDGAPQF